MMRGPFIRFGIAVVLGAVSTTAASDDGDDGGDDPAPVAVVQPDPDAVDPVDSERDGDRRDDGATAGVVAIPVIGPDAVDALLAEDLSEKIRTFELDLLAPLDALRRDLAEATGVTLGADYTATYLRATDAIGDDEAASGIARFFGRWDAIRSGDDVGGVIWKIEHRHRMTATPPQGLQPSIGAVGLTAPPFSDEGLRLTNLYWRQSFADARVVVYAGFLDTTDYVDAYALASPWTGFSNLVFSTGSATIGLPSESSLGVMLGGWLTDQLYAIGSISDANADPTDPFGGFETFFGDFETFKTIELGWTPGRDRFFLDNVHVTAWHVDERDEAGTPDGWGLNASASAWIDERWLPFVRGGWSNDGGALLEASASAGVGYQAARGGDVLGVGLNWGRPSRDTFGASLNDQYTAEVFYRWQATRSVQVTPSVQLIVDPALNPDHDAIAIFGIRGRVSF